MDEVEVCKALGDPTRLKILELIRKKELCICEIVPETGKSQPNVSQHLKVLRIAGLINVRKDGTKIMVSVANKAVYDILDRIKSI